MKYFLAPLVLFGIFGIGGIPPQPLASPTDAELDTIGPAGGNLAEPPENSDLNLLSDQSLSRITAKGSHGFNWLIPNGTLKLPSNKRITWSSGGQNIDLGPAIQFRANNPPPTPPGAGSPNSFSH